MTALTVSFGFLIAGLVVINWPYKRGKVVNLDEHEDKIS